MCKFKIIACINKKNALGIKGGLLYRIGSDLANFKRQTVNNVVIMGRKTYESLPNGSPLKDRVNIIITSNTDFGVDKDFNNVFIVSSIDDAVELCEAFFTDKELFVIGGESIYRQFLEKDLVDEMRLTVVDDDAEGDVVFPIIDDAAWHVYYKSLSQVSKCDDVEHSFYFEILKKK